MFSASQLTSPPDFRAYNGSTGQAQEDNQDQQN